MEGFATLAFIAAIIGVCVGLVALAGWNGYHLLFATAAPTDDQSMGLVVLCGVGGIVVAAVIGLIILIAEARG